MSARFTAAGAAVVLATVTLCGGLLDTIVFGGPGTLFGIVFLCACLYTAARVRSCDLMAAPICAPIAFAIALAVTVPPSGSGFSGQLLGLATGLAMHAGWLYSGTVVAAALVLLRWFTLRAASRSA